MEENKYILEMHDIIKVFPGVRALDNAQLRIKKGEVHALIGENGAGKSTLMKILLGIYRPESGEIIYKGTKVKFQTPHEALSAGISMIHQEMSLIPTVDISENVWIGRERDFRSCGLIINKKRYQETEKLLKHLKIDLNPRTIINTLSVANMQLVELARAVSYHSDIIIMDEPTSSLTDSEIRLLYDIVRELSNQGTAVIFISHKLEEIFEICDRVTVMRDGQFISEHSTGEITQDELVTKIAGREVTELYPKVKAKIKETVLEVRNLCSKQVFDHISFDVKAGEVLGFCGLVGAGRTEIMRAIFGIDHFDSGEIYLEGKKIVNRTPKDAIANGISMITEDRRGMGIVPMLSVCANISLAYLPTLGKAGFIQKARETADIQKMIKDLNVKTPSLSTNIGDLSGGNQQKAIIARWLLTKPKVLILDEPTRGVDVGAKSEIYQLINTLTQQGIAVIMVSSELPEILGMSDRIIVVREGKIVMNTKNSEMSSELLLKHAFGANK